MTPYWTTHITSKESGQPRELSKLNPSGVLFEDDDNTMDRDMPVDIKNNKETETFEAKWLWSNIFMFSYVHISGLYGGYLMFTKAQWATVIFSE